jgi:16S rRNA (cytosine967-C5)-methyltransferase
VQDPATDLAIDLLDPQPGMRLLDACAAPGGKTFACADRMQNKGQIIALDRHLDRLARMQENMQRLQFSIIKHMRADATNPRQLPQNTFDRILLDVPCSNSGVLQRRPDARWRITPERIAAMTDVQTRMLDATAPLLAPDGALVYSTCSLEPEENQLCIENWIHENPAFQIMDTRTSIPPASQMDGAFAARIERKATG